MARKLLLFLYLAGLVIGLASPIFALEKVKLATAVKEDPGLYLPILAAEDKGFWKENGLEVEWVPFGSTGFMMQGVAAGEISMGLDAIGGPMQAAERGVPVVMVAELAPSSPFLLWVRADSPSRQPRDLKGARIGISRLGSAGHAFGRLIFKAHGVEKDVRFVGTGSPAAIMAALKAGAIEATVLPLVTVAGLKAEGIIRGLASAADYRPKPWSDYVIFARKDYARSRPDLVRKVLKATLQTTDFMRKNPRWALDKMKSFGVLSEEATKVAYGSIEFTITGRLDWKAVENARKFLMEYGFLTEKAPAVDGLFSNEYLPR